MKQYSYRKDDGVFDYERYLEVQITGNKRKLGSQWVHEHTLKFLSEYILSKIKPRFGICHGTRRGLEQLAFRKFLNCEVIGTEISDTATQFLYTIQWDFHDVKSEWIGAVDFIYSNSWDHSYDPDRMFRAWMSCLTHGGLLILEHSDAQEDISELDPLGMSLTELCDFIEQLSGPSGECVVIDLLKGPPRKRGIDTRPMNVVFQRRVSTQI